MQFVDWNCTWTDTRQLLPNKLFCCCFLPYCAKRLVCQASVARKCFVLCQLFGSLASAWRNCRENTQRIPQSENSSLLGGPANPYRKLYQSPTTVLGKSCSKLSKLCFSKRFVFASSKWTLLVLQTWSVVCGGKLPHSLSWPWRQKRKPWNTDTTTNFSSSFRHEDWLF